LPRARDLLNRFRPSGTPGAAGAAGVPVDREAGTADELAPLFSALAPTERECEALIAGAEADARRIRRRADEEAARLVTEAGERQASERAAVVAEVRDHRAAAAAAAAVDAERRAAAIRDRAASRTGACVDDVVAAVRAFVGDTA